MKKNLVFLDVETTGLNEGRDHIVELAMVVVELPTFREVAHFSSIVVPPLWATVRRNLHEKVEAMHRASGLLEDIDAAHEIGNFDTHLIEGAALGFIREFSPHTPAWHTPLAGANPDFDRRFLRAWMPKLHAAFHYRNFDVRSVTLLSDWVFGIAHIKSPHRALADCRQAVQQIREFIGPQPTPGWVGSNPQFSSANGF